MKMFGELVTRITREFGGDRLPKIVVDGKNQQHLLVYGPVVLHSTDNDRRSSYPTTPRNYIL